MSTFQKRWSRERAGLRHANRAPERQHTGIVKWFDNTKAYGFLVDADGKDVFVHAGALLDRDRPLEKGQRVTFERAMNRGAVDVAVLAE
jgi:cold shock CspA family protein